MPDGMPSVAWHSGLDGAKIDRPVPTGEAQEMRRAYYACVSYTDSLVGQVLAELERLNLQNDTVVAVRRTGPGVGVETMHLPLARLTSTFAVAA